MYDPSFNPDYWASQPLEDFIDEASRFKWSEQDATVYHAKIKKDLGIEDPVDKTPSKNDSKPAKGKNPSNRKLNAGNGEGDDTGK